MKTVFLVILLATTVAQAETYKWTDKEGTVHFSASLTEVPAPYRGSAKPLDVDISGPANKGKAVSPPALGQGADDRSIAPKVEEMKERMMHDEGTMAIIRALQDDPELQALLGDPAMMRAIQTMDIGALMNNPAFMNLLNNPRVRDIGKRMQHGGM